MPTKRQKINSLKQDLDRMKKESPGLKPNFSLLARESGISRQTVSRLWNGKEEPKKPRKKKPSQFDPYYEEIREKLESAPSTKKAVFKYFQMKYPESVFKSYDSFKSYVKSSRFKNH